MPALTPEPVSAVRLGFAAPTTFPLARPTMPVPSDYVEGTWTTRSDGSPLLAVSYRSAPGFAPLGYLVQSDRIIDPKGLSVHVLSEQESWTMLPGINAPIPNHMGAQQAASLAWGLRDGEPLLAYLKQGRARLIAPSGSPTPPELEPSEVPATWLLWDGASLLAGGENCLLRWDLPNGSLRRINDEVLGRQSWGRLAGDHSVLACCDSAGSVTIWDAQHLVRLGDPVLGASTRWGTWGAYLSTNLLVTGASDGRLLVIDPVRGARTLDGPKEVGDPWLSWAEWAPTANDTPTLLTGGAAGWLVAWRPFAHSQPHVINAQKPRSTRWGSAIRVGDRNLLACGGDSLSELWDVDEGSELATIDLSRTSWGGWAGVEGTPVLATLGADGSATLRALVRDVVQPRVPRYSADATGAGDRLQRSGDAEALADLITARAAKPPLAVGVFGPWGEGKSLFLDLVRDQVRRRADAAGGRDPIAHGHVSQVEFNAWHYAESDLWASLVAELYGQLHHPRTGDGIGTREMSRLAAELAAAHGLEDELAQARARAAELSAAQATPTPWPKLSPQTRADLHRLLGQDANEIYSTWQQSKAAIPDARRTAGRLLRSLPKKYYVVTVVSVLLTLAVLLWGPGLLSWLAAIPFVAAVISGVSGLRRTWTDLAPVRQTASDTWERLKDWEATQAARLAADERAAQAEVDRLERQIRQLTAAGRLADLAKDRDTSGSYREHLGLMTQIRLDFEAMAEILLGEQDLAVEDAVGDTLPKIDRIVIYIDDLDRCPPRRVVEVLEAVHLLLAVRLFVVVVAVDPRWLLRSLEAHYRELFDVTTATTAADSDTWASTPAQYLEKIFQIVLTLPAMDQSGYVSMIDDLLGIEHPHSMSPDPTSNTQGRGTSPRATDNFARATDRPRVQASYAPPRRTQQTFAPTALPERIRVDPLALTPEEHRLIGLLGPPLVTSPRAVKRLANSYGLLVALTYNRNGASAEERVAPQHLINGGESYYPYRAGAVLLAVVVGFPMLGPSLFPYIHRAARLKPDGDWTDLVAGLVPRLGDDGIWTNDASTQVPPSERSNWAKLAEALRVIDERTHAAGLDLPRALAAWAPWVVATGRLSFPTGTVVTGLVDADPWPGVR